MNYPNCYTCAGLTFKLRKKERIVKEIVAKTQYVALAEGFVRVCIHHSHACKGSSIIETIAS